MSKYFGFSVLGSDVDLDDMHLKRKPEKQSKAETPPPAPAKKTSAKPKANKKAKEVQSLQALAFGDSKPKKKSAGASQNASKASKAAAADKKKSNNMCNGAGVEDGNKALSEDWQSRDQKYVEEVHEKELREALMLSKLDYEANRIAPDAAEQQPRENSKTKKKKKDKPVTISLSEFNSLNDKKSEAKRPQNGVVESTKKSATSKAETPKSDNFFSDLDSSVRNTIANEARQKKYAEHLAKQRAAQPSNTGSVLVPISEVEKRDFEIQALRLEVESLKDSLEKVKLRNKKLCEVLGAAEMRTVGEIVVELEKVSRARDELSAEVAKLSEQLEQEKTKVSQLQEKTRKK
ncbi:G kinase-anchoring protein 1 [Hyalella azteca]|uniref:G kinase-anchoring protein 1 n=1 Tax=Hyalella azteca TaxID=294128 RepID=A0A8B7PI53_HYAAZ|nr:G kinase-anchoring protein 1 [Hyalella azteca]